MALYERVGLGCTIDWDSTGGTSFTPIGSVVDGEKTEAKAKTAKTALLSDTWDTFAKCSIDPGEFKFTIAYDPLYSEYHSLATSLAAVNTVAPNWRLSFPDNGNGSGATTETFRGLVVAMSREVKKDSFLIAEVTIKLTGNAGLKTS